MQPHRDELVSIAATILGGKKDGRALIVHNAPRQAAAAWIREVAPGQVVGNSYHVVVVGVPVDSGWFYSCISTRLEPEGRIVFVSDGREPLYEAVPAALGST